ncbi:polysaccharide biosynthesis protein [Runella slithyformis DSM 19594]|uniref:Polysaccharide biosynthesis protein n=2 Tax=Runella TaxID=105 RepID=A0A7U4E892_RUNSL|nr:polysaccharide biosynthesis protein [Runella slithyformis DSM 19594]
MSGFGKIFGGVAWSIISNFTGAAYSFFSVPVLLSYFGKQYYGLIGIALSVNVYLRILDMGFSSGNIKYFSAYLVQKDKTGLNGLFQSSLFIYISIAAVNAFILLILSIFCQSIFKLSVEESEIFKQLLYILIVTSFPIWGANVMEQLLRSYDLIAWQQRVLLLSKIGQLAVLLLTIILKLSIVNFFALNTFCYICIIPLYISRINKLNLGISFIPRYHRKTIAEVLPYCLSVFSFGLFQFSANYLRPVLLGIKLGLTSVTDFRLIEGIANLILMLGSSFVGVILPYATKAKTLGDKKAEMQIAGNGTRYISIFLAFLIFGIVLSSKELISLYVGPQNVYLAFWFNIWALSLLGLHNSALSSIVLSGNILKPIVYMSAFSSVLSLTLAWVLMDYFGMGGVIISNAVYVIIQMGYYYIYYYPAKLGYNSIAIFLHSFFFISLTVGCLCGGIYYVFDNTRFSNLYYAIFFKEIVFVIIFIATIYTFFLTNIERVYILNRIKNIKI